MQRLQKVFMALLVTALLLAMSVAGAADPVMNNAAFTPSQFGRMLCVTADIIDPAKISGAYFAAGTPTGMVDVNVTTAPTRATYTGTQTYQNITDVVGPGSIRVNGNTIFLTAADTVKTLVEKINALWDRTEVTARCAAGAGITLTSSDYGSDHSIDLTDPDAIVNGGYAVQVRGVDAQATVTYGNGSTESYTSGKGVQLIGDSTGGRIYLSTEGGTAVANLTDCINIAFSGESACYVTSVIRDRQHVLSASFAPGTPEGPLDVQITTTATKATHTGFRIFADTDVTLVAAGSFVLNGWTITTNAADHADDVVAKINAVSDLTDVMATVADGAGIIFTQKSYGSGKWISLVDTDSLINDGVTVHDIGADAEATITYGNATTEPYHGNGLQLTGSDSGGIINLAPSGNTVTMHPDAIRVVPADLIGCGDSLTVTLDIADDSAISSVTCPEVPTLVHLDGNIWTGTMRAASTLGYHELTFTVTDSDGVYELTGYYVTVPCFGATMGSTYDPVMDAASTNNIFSVFGQTTRIDADNFYLSDGFGKELRVTQKGHGYSDGDHVTVRGQLDMGSLPHTLYAHSASKTE